MKKSDLKNRMVVETREGERYIVTGDELLSENGLNKLNFYNEDLINGLYKEFDIVKVYREIVTLADTNSQNLELLWERKWKPEFGDRYYVAAPSSILDNYYIYSKWEDVPSDYEWYNRGLIFKTKEEAIECSERMLAVARKGEC